MESYQSEIDLDGSTKGLVMCSRRTDDAIKLVEKHHYTKKAPIRMSIKYSGVAYDDGKPFAACCFGYGLGRWGNTGGMKAEGGIQLLELVRLVKAPGHDSFPLSKLVSFTLSEIKKTRLHDLVISYADPQHAHHGGIYQACSWLYHGVTSTPKLKITVNGKEYSTRTLRHMEVKKGITHIKPRRKRWRVLFQNQEVVVEKQPCKHIYWKPLNKRGMRSGSEIGLKDTAYPKPEHENEQRKVA